MQYRIVKSNSHKGLEDEINKAATDGWVMSRQVV
jgi:hypothetical protein